MASKGTCIECGREKPLDNNGKVAMHAPAGLTSRRAREAAGPCPGVGKNPVGSVPMPAESPKAEPAPIECPHCWPTADQHEPHCPHSPGGAAA